jgi:hypothetical protein
MNNPEAREALQQLKRITLSTSPTEEETSPLALLDDSDPPPGGRQRFAACPNDLPTGR